MIVDDDPISRKNIELYCKKFNELEIAYICKDAEEGLKVLEKDAEVELIFLDIEMPGLNGIEFLGIVKYMPLVIITTSNKEYAYDAFKYEAVDYLHKPISLANFKKAVDKAIEKHRQIIAYKELAGAVYMRFEGRYVRVAYDDILYFENAGDYVKVKTNGPTYIIHSTLKNIGERLRDGRFLKVHRSYIINLDKIVDIEENTLVIDQKVIPISRANRPVLMGRLNFI